MEATVDIGNGLTMVATVDLDSHFSRGLQVGEQVELEIMPSSVLVNRRQGALPERELSSEEREVVRATVDLLSGLGREGDTGTSLDDLEAVARTPPAPPPKSPPAKAKRR